MKEPKKKAPQKAAFFSLPRKINMASYRPYESGKSGKLCNGRIRKIYNACYRALKKEVRKMLYNRKAFGVVISTLRVRKGLTQEKLSGLAGIACSHLLCYLKH